MYNICSHLSLFCTNISINMSQSAYTIRLDSELKNQFDSLCEDFGMSATTAFSIFIRSVIRNRRIPFAIEASPVLQTLTDGKAAFDEMRKTIQEKGIEEMSLDEINTLIDETRKE